MFLHVPLFVLTNTTGCAKKYTFLHTLFENSIIQIVLGLEFSMNPAAAFIKIPLSNIHHKHILSFLSADAPGRLSYHLDSCKSASLYNSGTLIDDSKKFYRTDVRLEQTTLWNCIANDNLSDTTLVIFTHKNKFGRYAKIKLHALMLFLWLNNYEFVIDL